MLTAMIRESVFKQLFNEFSDLVYLMAVEDGFDFRYVTANEAGLKAAGLTEQAMGMLLQDVLSHDVVQYLLPKYREAVEKQKPVHYELETALNDGMTIIGESILNPIVNEDGICTHVVAVVRDITNRKKSEEALRQSEARFRLIADNISDLIATMDVHGRISYASPSYKAILGRDHDERNPFFDMAHPEDLSHVKHVFFDMIRTKSSRQVVFRTRHMDGRYIYLESKGMPVVNESGIIEHIVVVARDITERKKSEETIKHMAYHDTLTGLPNRRLFNEELVRSLDEASQNEGQLAVLFVDMDGFKAINDTLGHAYGDLALQAITGRLNGSVRGNDRVFRMGGDEFTILLPKIRSAEDAMTVAERILSLFKDPLNIEEHRLQLTTSIGISLYPNDGENAELLLKNADIAMYQAKQNGKNHFRFFGDNIA